MIRAQAYASDQVLEKPVKATFSTKGLKDFELFPDRADLCARMARAAMLESTRLQKRVVVSAIGSPQA